MACNTVESNHGEQPCHAMNMLPCKLLPGTHPQQLDLFRVPISLEGLAVHVIEGGAEGDVELVFGEVIKRVLWGCLVDPHGTQVNST